jgi:hypothetical protein
MNYLENEEMTKEQIDELFYNGEIDVVDMLKLLDDYRNQ